MRKNRFLILTYMVSLIIVLTGCSSSENKDNETQTKSVAENVNEVFDQAPEGKEVVTDYSKFVKTQESQDYNFETDYQYYLTSTWGIANIENSYYIEDYGLTKVLDVNSRTYTLLCAKPNCGHDDYTCSAVIPNNSGIAYYNGNLYSICDSEFIESQEKGMKKFSVVKTSLAGDTKDKVADIMKVATKDMNISQDSYTMDVRYIQHRGYMYYVYITGNITGDDEFYMNGSNCIYRISLDGSKEPECILPLEKGCNSAHMYMKAEGSYIYFVMADNMAFGELYRYNTEADVVEKMNIGTIAAETYNIINGKILYKKTYDAKQLYLYNPLINTEELFADMTDMAEGDSWDIRRDRDWIYIYYTDTSAKKAFFTVLDMDGNYIGKIILSDQYEEGDYLALDLFAGGTDWIVCHIFGTEDYLYFNKPDIK